MSRNVVLVTIDSLRADHCGFMGYERETTPTLDRMADEGLVFENAVAPGPRTFESIPATFTEEYPLLSARGEDRLVRRREHIRRHLQTRETLAERFSRRGYETIGISPNPYTSRYFGFDQGFDHFQDFLAGEDRASRLRPDLESSFALRLAWGFLNQSEMFKPWEAFYDELLERVRDIEEPYFLWVLLMDAHEPYFVPREYRSRNSTLQMLHGIWKFWMACRESTPTAESATGPSLTAGARENIVDAYDDAIRYADAFLDRLRTDLADDDPVYVVHADHGEAFGEHGTYGHQTELYEENVHVPLVITGTDTTGTVQNPASLRYLTTYLEQISTDRQPDPSVLTRRPIVARTPQGNKVALRADDWKVLDDRNDTRLFNLSTSANEKTDLSNEYPILTGAFDDLLDLRSAEVSEKRAVRRAVSDIRGGRP